jgi:hypothetical protein
MCYAVCALIVVFSWVGTQVSAVDNATESLVVPHAAPVSTRGKSFATAHSVLSRLIFRYASPEDTAGPSSTPSVRRLEVFSSVNLTISPQDVTNTILLQLPPAAFATLKRLQVVGMDASCDLKGSMCLCETGAVNSSTLPAELTTPFSKCVADCSYVLKPNPLPLSAAYDAPDWYQLLLPCTLQPERRYVLEVLSAPAIAFAPSDPYPVNVSTSAAAAAASGSNGTLQNSSISSGESDSGATEWLESGVLASSKRFEPSVLEKGSFTAFHRLIVTAPAGLKVLASAEEERSAVHPGACFPDLLSFHLTSQHFFSCQTTAITLNPLRAQ